MLGKGRNPSRRRTNSGFPSRVVVNIEIPHEHISGEVRGEILDLGIGTCVLDVGELVGVVFVFWRQWLVLLASLDDFADSHDLRLSLGTKCACSRGMERLIDLNK